MRFCGLNGDESCIRTALELVAKSTQHCALDESGATCDDCMDVGAKALLAVRECTVPVHGHVEENGDILYTFGGSEPLFRRKTVMASGGFTYVFNAELLPSGEKLLNKKLVETSGGKLYCLLMEGAPAADALMVRKAAGEEEQGSDCDVSRHVCVASRWGRRSMRENTHVLRLAIGEGEFDGRDLFVDYVLTDVLRRTMAERAAGHGNLILGNVSPLMRVPLQHGPVGNWCPGTLQRRCQCDLHEVLLNTSSIDKVVLYSLASVARFIHDAQIAISFQHRDLRPPNILVDCITEYTRERATRVLIPGRGRRNVAFDNVPWNIYVADLGGSCGIVDGQVVACDHWRSHAATHLKGEDMAFFVINVLETIGGRLSAEGDQSEYKSLELLRDLCLETEAGSQFIADLDTPSESEVGSDADSESSGDDSSEASVDHDGSQDALSSGSGSSKKGWYGYGWIQAR